MKKATHHPTFLIAVHGASITIPAELFAQNFYLLCVLPRETHVKGGTDVEVEPVGAQRPPCLENLDLLLFPLESMPTIIVLAPVRQFFSCYSLGGAQ